MLIEKLTEFSKKYDMLPSGALILAAVSGGRDSMCLLDVLSRLSSEKGFAVAAAHFNHNLRGDESDGDESFVLEYCRERGIACHTGSGDVAAEAAETGCGIEETARRLRYAFLEETAKKTGASRIATAHNSDDNAETVLLNMARGSGLRGMCGIPPVRGALIRPLLSVSRAEIDEYVEQNKIPYRDDSTNFSDEYSRNRVRHSVIPVLKELNPSFCESVSALTSHLRDDEELLDRLARDFIDANLRGRRVSASKLLCEPRAVSSRVIRRLCPRAAGDCHVDAVLRLCSPEKVSACADLPGIRVFREYDDLIFGKDAPSGSFPETELTVGSSVVLGDTGIEISCEETVFVSNIYNSLTTFLFKSDSVCGKIYVRPRKTGDKIRLSLRGGTKSLKKLFIEKRIPAAMRQSVPVISDDIGAAAVAGIGADIRMKPCIGDTVLKITVKDINKHE